MLINSSSKLRKYRYCELFIKLFNQLYQTFKYNKYNTPFQSKTVKSEFVFSGEKLIQIGILENFIYAKDTDKIRLDSSTPCESLALALT